METYWCANCGVQHVIGKRVGAKVGLALAGGAVGTAARDPLLTILLAIGGVIVGHIIDESVLPQCPDCGAVLQFIDEAFL